MKFGIWRLCKCSKVVAIPCASLLKKLPHLPIACARINDGAHKSNILINLTLYLAQYNAIQNKDADTFYNITDDYSNNGLPSAGATGQVLAKASNSDYDTEWVSQHSFSHETWTFTLDDDSTVDKEVVLW